GEQAACVASEGVVRQGAARDGRLVGSVRRPSSWQSRRRRALVGDFLEQGGHVVPQLPPRLPFRLGELGQRLGFTNRDEVVVLLPMRQPLHPQLLGRRFIARRLLRVTRQIVFQPVRGLPPEPKRVFVGGGGGVCSLAAPRQRRAAGGVVAIQLAQVVGELGV